LGHQAADRDVLLDVLGVLLVREPPALEIGGDPETEAVRVDFLTHYLRPLFELGTSTLSTSIVMWLVRLRMRYARPWARGRNLFSVGPSSTYAREMINESGSSEKLFSALAIALASTLATGSLAACGANLSSCRASCAGMSRISSTTRRAFIGVTR